MIASYDDLTQWQPLTLINADCVWAKFPHEGSSFSEQITHYDHVIIRKKLSYQLKSHSIYHTNPELISGESQKNFNISWHLIAIIQLYCLRRACDRTKSRR